MNYIYDDFMNFCETPRGALRCTCQFIWSMFAIIAFVNSCHYFFFFFTWHVALGHWRYWFKNNNRVAVWTPIYERIHKTFTYSNTFRLFFSGNPFHCQILLISLTLLSRWANTSQHQDSLSRRETNIIMHPIRERVSGYKTETIKAYMSSFFFLSRHV